MFKRILLTGLVLLMSSSVHSAVYQWTDWTTGLNDTNGFTGSGIITTDTSTVNVTYNNPNGISFFQASEGIDYWQNNRNGRNPDSSPYTSAVVENIPTGTDIVALNQAGLQTLTFSEAIANPVFSYVSLNGNGYAFDQDFEILSFGAGLGATPPGDNDCGYWGCGTSSKNIVDLGEGNFEYQLIGTGEPHGTLRFLGAFDTLVWRSLSNENWNGFTVGVEGTEDEVFPPNPNPVPVPAAVWLFGTALLGFIGVSRRRKVS